MKKMNRVSNQIAVATAVPSHPDFPEIEKLTGTFSINVKVDVLDENGDEVFENGKKKTNLLYTNDDEPFTYYKVPSLVSALRLEGAKLSDDQVQFMNEALGGTETGKAVSSLLEVYNDNLKATAQRRQYASVLTEKTPITDETRGNAHASLVRNFMKTSGVSPEIAIDKLKSISAIPTDYNVGKFLANKGKR